jgi:hypothetical protein
MTFAPSTTHSRGSWAVCVEVKSCGGRFAQTFFVFRNEQRVAEASQHYFFLIVQHVEDDDKIGFWGSLDAKACTAGLHYSPTQWSVALDLTKIRKVPDDGELGTQWLPLSADVRADPSREYAGTYAGTSRRKQGPQEGVVGKQWSSAADARAGAAREGLLPSPTPSSSAPFITEIVPVKKGALTALTLLPLLPKDGRVPRVRLGGELEKMKEALLLTLSAPSDALTMELDPKKKEVRCYGREDAVREAVQILAQYRDAVVSSAPQPTTPSSMPAAAPSASVSRRYLCHSGDFGTAC